MSPLLRNQIGYNEAILDESPSFDTFFRWADLITDKLGVSFTRKLDDFEALYWDFLALLILLAFGGIYSTCCFRPSLCNCTHRLAFHSSCSFLPCTPVAEPNTQQYFLFSIG